MNTLGKALVTATAVVAVALACTGCGASADNVTVVQTPTPTSTAAPTVAASTAPTASPSATLAVLPDGEPMALKPGRYTFASLHNGVPAQLGATYPRMSFTVPSGWSGNSTLVGTSFVDGGPATPFLFDWNFDHGYKDPCTDHTPVVPAAGSGAAGLLGVIARQPGVNPGPIYGSSVAGIKDVTVGGHAGKYVDYTVTVDPATCGNGQDGFWIWGACPPPVTIGCEDASGGDRRWGASKGDRERAYAIDVDGTIYTFFTAQPGRMLAADRAEFQRFLDSIEFEPATS